VSEIIRESDFDYATYERQTEASVKVRPASAWRDDLIAEFAVQEGGKSPHPTITSLRKLEGRIDFLPGEITVWAGYSGHRKSMLMGQVVLDLIDQKRRTLVASFEMMPARTLARMARQASGHRFPTPAWLERFGHWTDGRLWVFDHMGRLSPSMMLAVCRYFAEEKKGQHIVIDSMMMVCASEESMDEQKQFATDLVRIAQETGLHLHLVAHCRKPQAGDEKAPTKYDVRGSAAITDQAHNVITVWANKGKADKLPKAQANDVLALQAQPDAVVSVEKQRSGSYEGKVQLWFDERSLRFMDDRTERVEPYAGVFA